VSANRARGDRRAVERGAGPAGGLSLAETWSRLHPEQRVAGIAAALLIVSTLGPFSFVEAAEILAAGAVLALLRQRAKGRPFHLPLGDGTAILAAGVWCGVLIATRIFDRPPGMTALALVCALLLAAAGLRERAKRAPDDLPNAIQPTEPAQPAVRASVPEQPPPVRVAPPKPPEPPPPAPAPAKPADPDVTRQLSLDEDVTAVVPERQPPDPPA
jgi:hypothetical protein